MGGRRRLESGEGSADRSGRSDCAAATGASRSSAPRVEPDASYTPALESRLSPRPLASARRSPQPFRVERIFSLPHRLQHSARAAAERAIARAAQRGRGRIWVPCCKMGGVAYAVAMLLSDAAVASPSAAKLFVFGTDVDEEALDLARAGRYPASAALDMRPEWRACYTVDEGDTIRVAERLRHVCIFSRHQLLRDPPMSRMDLIVCQRVFHGVSAAKRGELLERLHFALREGGSLLALDHAEDYPPSLFDRVGAGHLVARAAAASHKTRSLLARAAPAARAVARVRRGPVPGREAPAATRSASPVPAEAAPFLRSLGQPLVLCDASLRVIYASHEVARAWGVSDASWGAPLDAIAGRLPGGAEIASTARVVLFGTGPREVVVREAQRTFLARIAAADGARGVSILFTEVTRFLATATPALVAPRLMRASEPLPVQTSVAAEELYQALYAELPVCVSMHDTGGALRSVNARLSALGADASAPADGRSPQGDAMLRRLYQDELPSWLDRVLTTGEPIFDVELDVAEAGEKRYWLCNLAPIHSRRGELLGATVVVQDISAARRAEAALHEADRQKDEYIALLGHELRNPMAAIRNATELLGRLEQPTPQLLRLKSIFERQTAQTAQLIDALLDMARVARGKVELKRVPLELLELVRQAVDDRGKQFEARELQLQLPEGELWVLADRVRLIQVLDNLIANALKFTRLGGRISIELRRLPAGARLRVEDDGDGIEPELLPVIFEPFRQGRPTTAHGLGLGLALVKGLCQLHGFAITAHSSGAGRGACFQIDFPLVPAPDEAPPASRVDCRRLDLLLVEDNPDVADTLAELLRAEGHTVEVVGCAERGLEALRERQRDAVISDIGLPGMDGLALARSLRGDPVLCSVKLVALTGFGDAATEARIKAAGFDRCLIKPVQLEALRRCLARVAAL